MKISIKLLGIFVTVAAKTHVPVRLLESICFTESGFKIYAVHKDDGGEDSVGICQIKYSTAKWLHYKGPQKDIFNPSINILYAAKYLHYQLIRYHSVPRALTAYNRGNATNLMTSAYARKVMKNESIIDKFSNHY